MEYHSKAFLSSDQTFYKNLTTNGHEAEVPSPSEAENLLASEFKTLRQIVAMHIVSQNCEISKMRSLMHWDIIKNDMKQRSYNIRRLLQSSQSVESK